ncbi:MAG: alpha-amylase family glycosyl hydrolase, partial [Roseiflexaceae bacterium]
MMPRLGSSNAPGMEFHVSRAARDRYQFDESLFSISGNVVFANFHAARVFAQKMNQRRDLVRFPEQAVHASQINALGLVHEVTHYVFQMYREQQNPRVLQEALEWLEGSVGPAAVEAALLRFVNEFPPLAVYRREISPEAYLEGQTDSTPNRQVALEEMLMLWMSNLNPAFGPFLDLFDDTALEQETAYPTIMSSLYTFFGARPVTGWLAGMGAGADGERQLGSQNLIDILRAPARAAPHSLEAQLRFAQERWGALLGRYVYRLFASIDLIKEEQKPVFLGPGPIEVPVFDAAQAGEPERFTPDRDWMPRLVLIAKNAYVWLDQLSKRYGQPIATLDQIPDEELDTLASRGISGLWLIGLWERSRASQRIKQIMGNPDAVASAYSLLDYEIAAKLGGDPACQNLRERAWQRGIRLSSDMVPNHVGIDGRWVIEHPDWFIALDYSPFPAYTFTGVDLSWDERV